MDHRWGRNLPDYGLGDLAVGGGFQPPYNPTLAARIIGGPYTGWYVLNVKIGGFVTLAFSSPLTELVTYGGVIPPAGISSHFPYGFPVEPDEHL